MDTLKIEKYKLIADELENFDHHYKGIELAGDRDGYVSPVAILAWLIENPHMAQMAAKINKLDKS